MPKILLRLDTFLYSLAAQCVRASCNKPNQLFSSVSSLFFGQSLPSSRDECGIFLFLHLKKGNPLGKNWVAHDKSFSKKTDSFSASVARKWNISGIIQVFNSRLGELFLL